MQLEWIESQCSKRIIEKGRQIADHTNIFSLGEHAYRVLCPRARITFSVHLTEDSYSCSCELDKPCAHIAAAMIAISRQSLSEANDFWWVKYELCSQNQSLMLTRYLCHGEDRKPANFSNMRQANVMVTDLDKKVEILLQGQFKGIPTKNTLRSIFELFESDKRHSFILDGVDLPFVSDVLLPIGVVEDKGEGFNVCIRRHRDITKVFSNAVICDGQLRITSRGDLSDIQFKRLAAGIEYNLDDVELLVCQVIPSLEDKIDVQILTERLPKALSVQPYLLIDSEQNGRELVLKPKIAYGEPMVAWVRGEHLEVEGEYVPIRKLREEKKIRKRAVDHLPIPMGADTRLSGERAVLFAERLAELVASRKDWKMSGPVVDSFKRVEELKPSIEIKDDDLEVDWGPASKESVLEAWRSGASLVQLENGGWAPIPSDWLAQYGHLIADLLSARAASADKKVPNFALFDLARLCDALNAPAPPKLAALKRALNDFEGLPPLERPKDLKAQLRNYQVEGVRWLQFLRTAQIGGILADDMGLGKTLQALCVIRKRSLVIAPTSVIHNWCLEVEKFRPDLSVCLYHGSSRILDVNSDIVVTSYAIVRNDVQKIKSLTWDSIILDEAQAIKNPNSQTAQAIFSLQGNMKLALTGTPIENRLQELWSLFHFLCPGLLQGLSEFRSRYELPISKGSAVAATQLRQRIKPFVLRRMKKEVAPELPPRTNIVLRCTLSEDEKRLYEAIRISTQKEIVRALAEGRFNTMTALEALLRLRQAACHSGLLPGHEAQTSSKIELLMESLNDTVASGHKALVFSQWTSMLDRIEPHLKSNSIRFIRLDGKTINRRSVVEEFSKEDGPSVFLSTLKSGGTGLNLTAADHVFLVDLWWNPAAEEQAADRAHRIGQSNPVMVYRLISEDTVEEKILLLQDRKRALAETALGDCNQASGLTRADFLNLLGADT